MPLMDETAWRGKIFLNGWPEGSGGDAAVIEPTTGGEICRVGVATPDKWGQRRHLAATLRPGLVGLTLDTKGSKYDRPVPKLTVGFDSPACLSGTSHNLLPLEIAAKLGAPKMASISRTAAEVVAANPGCLMQISQAPMGDSAGGRHGAVHPGAYRSRHRGA